MREKKVFLFEKFFLFFFFSSLKANEKGIMQHICGCDKDRAREDFFNLGIASLSLSLSLTHSKVPHAEFEFTF